MRNTTKQQITIQYVYPFEKGTRFVVLSAGYAIKKNKKQPGKS